MCPVYIDGFEDLLKLRCDDGLRRAKLKAERPVKICI